jgi:mannose-1-phosphate guanylyltransferase
MKAMILGAGKGTRLYPLTWNTPKPAIEIMGRPVIDMLLEQFANQGIREFVINTSHLGDEIQKVCRSGRQYNAEVLYSYEGIKQGGELLPRPLGSAGALKRIQKNTGVFDGTFIVVCGDALIDLDVWEALRMHYQNAATATVIVKEVPEHEVSKYGVVEFDAECRVKSFQEKPALHEARSCFVNTGIYIFERRMLDLIPDEGEYDIGSQLLPDLVARGERFFAHCPDFTWLDVGNFSDIFSTTRALMKGELDGFSMPGRRISRHIHAGIGASIRPTGVFHNDVNYVAPGSRVESGAALQGVNCIGANCLVKKGAVLRDCIVMGEYLEFGESTNLERCIITNDYIIEESGRHRALWEVDEVNDLREPEPAVQPEFRLATAVNG